MRVAEHIGGLARAVAPSGCVAITRALTTAGWAAQGAGVTVIDSELAMPLRPDRIGEATLRVAHLVTAPPVAPVIVHGLVTTDDAAAASFAGADPERIVAVDDLSLLLRRFPDDEALPWLAGLGSATALDGAPTSLVEPRSLTDAVVRYRPGRRAILRFDRADGGGAVYAKVHAGGRDVQAVRFHREVVAAVPGFPACHLLAHGPATGTVWTDDAGGVPMASAITGPDAGALVEQAAAGLARLHASGLDAPPDVALDRVLPEVERRARRLAGGEPALADVLDAVLARMQEDRPASLDEVTCYGDFHHEQIRVAGPGLVFLDLDSIRRGAPESDLAEFVAHLVATLGTNDGRTFELAMVLVDRYAAASARRIDARTLRWYLRAELVQRAFGAMKTLRPGWQDDARTLVELAAGRDIDGVVPSSMVRQRP